MRWRLKSLASRLFTQAFIQAQMKENIKAPRHWPLWGEFTGDLWIHKGSVTRKMFPFDDVIMQTYAPRVLRFRHASLGHNGLKSGIKATPICNCYCDVAVPSSPHIFQFFLYLAESRSVQTQCWHKGFHIFDVSNEEKRHRTLSVTFRVDW